MEKIWQKFKRKKLVVRQPKRSSNKVSNFELALQRSKFKNVTDNRKLWKKKRSNLQKEKSVLVPVEISDVSSLNEAMQSISSSSSSHSAISDPSAVKSLQRNTIFE